MKKKVAFLFIILLIVGIAAGCTSPQQYFIFGTNVEMSLTGSGKSKAEKNIVSELEAIDKLISATISGSDIDRINKAGAGEVVAVSEVTIELLRLAKDVWVKTGCAFNPAIAPVVEMWGFAPNDILIAGAEVKPPDSAEVTKTFSELCNFSDEYFAVDYENRTVTKKLAGARLDLGAVGKGYAAEIAYKIAREQKKIKGFLNVGGNIYTVQNDVRVGIRHPRFANAVFGEITLKNTSVTTSGDYEKFYTYDGGRYCHILDGRTGLQADNGGIISVTVIGENGALADAVSTSVFVLGLADGIKLLDEYGLFAIIIFDNNTYKLHGIENFKLSDSTYTEI